MCRAESCVGSTALYFFFFKQKTAYEMRISDWSSDVCSSDVPDSSGADSRIPGALALAAQQRRDLGQPLHPALRGDGLPTVPSQDGTHRHRRRQAVLTILSSLIRTQDNRRSHLTSPMDTCFLKTRTSRTKASDLGKDM